MRNLGFLPPANMIAPPSGITGLNFLPTNGGGEDDPKKKKKVYKTQAEVDAANAEVRAQAKRQNLLIADDAYVAKRPGDPVVEVTNPDGTPYVPKQMPSFMIKKLPDWVEKLEWDHGWQQPYYKDGDDIVYVDKQHYNSEKFRKLISDTKKN